MTRLPAGRHCAVTGHSPPTQCGHPPCVQARATLGSDLRLLPYPGRETDRLILISKVKCESGKPIMLDINSEKC